MLITEFGPQQTLSVRRPPALGRVFYVNHSDPPGSNDNNGIDPGTPFQTITWALGQCEDNRNDYIVVLDCWDQEPIYPVPIEISRVHIIGMSIPSMNLYPQLFGDGQDIFELNASYVEIAGFGFVSIGAAGIISGAAVTPGFGWIHHCTFATAAVSLANGIEDGGGQIGNMLIEDNFFGANITNNGLTGSFVNCIIRNNIFRDCAGIGINHGGVEVGAIIGNYFFHALALAPAIGWAIALAAGANGGLIMDNHASQSIDNAGTNPYRDVDGVNGWSENWTGNALINPNTG